MSLRAELDALRIDFDQLRMAVALKTDIDEIRTKASDEPIAFAWGGSPVAASMINIPLAHNLSIPANLAGSRYYNGTNPLAVSTFTLTRQPANTTIGTVSISTAGVATFSGAGSSALVAGDTLRMTATTIGGSLANVGITIAATRR